MSRKPKLTIDELEHLAAAIDDSLAERGISLSQRMAALLRCLLNVCHEDKAKKYYVAELLMVTYAKYDEECEKKKRDKE